MIASMGGRAMIQWASVLCLAAAMPAGAEGFSEGMSLGSFSEAMRASQPLLASRASQLRAVGILSEGDSVNVQVSNLEALAAGDQLASTPPRAQAPGGPNLVLRHLASLPGARAVAPPELDPEAVQAFDQQGRIVEKADERSLERVIDEIVSQYVHTSAAAPAVRSLLRVAARARLQEAAASSDEARGLMLHLRDHVASRLDPNYPRRPTGFSTVRWDGSLNGKIIATYLRRGICVGATYANMSLLMQTTVMFHELLHAFDDGEFHNGPGSTDGSAISVNRFSGSSFVNPASGDPRERNGSEALAYRRMTGWVEFLGDPSLL